MFLVLQHYFLCFKKEVSPALLRRFSEPYQIMLFVTHIWNQSGLCESLFCAVDTKAGLLFPTFCLIRDFSLCCFAPIHRNHLFPRKIQYFLVPPAVREPTVFWVLSLQRSIKFWAENSLSHLRLFFSLKDFLASVLGSCATPAADDNAGLFPPPGKKGDLIERPTL